MGFRTLVFVKVGANIEKSFNVGNGLLMGFRISVLIKFWTGLWKASMWVMGFRSFVLVKFWTNIGNSSMWVLRFRIFIGQNFGPVFGEASMWVMGFRTFVLLKIRVRLWKTFNVCNGLPYSCLGHNLDQPWKAFNVGNGLTYSCLSQILGQSIGKASMWVTGVRTWSNFGPTFGKASMWVVCLCVFVLIKIRATLRKP